METITLPAVLPGDLDLAEINQQLKAGQVELDWSAVQSVDREHLAVLLEGLEIGDNADCLGINGTMAESIMDAIVSFIDNQPETVESKPTRSPEPQKQTVQPQTWQSSPASETPESLATTPENFAPENEFSEQEDKTAVSESFTLQDAIATSPYQLRAKLEDAILKDLQGPLQGEYEEVDEQYLTERYLIGILAPLHRVSRAEEQPEQQEELANTEADSTEEGNTDTTATAKLTMFPSSLGMTFVVSGKAKALEVTAKWGQYNRETSEYGDKKRVWKRYPVQGTTQMQLDADEPFHWVVDKDVSADVYVAAQVQQSQGDWLISLFLVNNRTETQKLRDQTWLFQPELQVKSADPDYPDIFIAKSLPSTTTNLDPLVKNEQEKMAMLYRHCVEFAVGHNVGVYAETSRSHPRRAVCLTTKVAPTYEVPQTTPPTVTEIPELAGLVLDMQVLADTSDEDLKASLQPLVTAYQTWIEQQRQRLDDPQENLEHYQTVAKEAIADCETTLKRIQAGIDLLFENADAIAAFRFMNAAMARQRLRSIYAEQKRRNPQGDNSPSLDEINRPQNRSWYPFQLAFILLNLPSLTDLHHRDRSDPAQAVCDLLWFPTGGGKTEAYLGLTAYTIGLRRKQKIVAGRDGEHGVAVLMRYTLRLLTLQQFQRATTLICACEHLRRQDPKQWGNEPIRIGLWVGQNSTPNYTTQSEEFVKQSKGQYQNYHGGTPHQLTNCPWCGTEIDPGKHLIVEPYKKGRGRTLIKCGDKLGQCEFSQGDGLPVVVVDEEIYRTLPTLLIATVDKFAQMPWKGEVQMLFGQVNGKCERHGYRSPDLEDSDRHNKTGKFPAAKTRKDILPLRPPDLIIQDELHLISGPLGTLVGLYETAVDRLATWEVQGKAVRPKVIASTATIKQAQSQVHSLFLRNLQVFPPQGLDIRDNFFSRQRPTSEATPGRLYLGICAPGRRLKAALIRVYVAALGASQKLYHNDGYGKAIDPWMTLVGYFNSLRELGGTRRLVEDDIRTRLEQKELENRGLAQRRNIQLEELTSRKSSTEIPKILDWLETPFDPEQTAQNKAHRRQGKKLTRKSPLDIVLATNMISVGVDVKRLGLMVTCGQPKNTAEYIQATSRVGRSAPGLVITVYNWTRPRDLSHYERFEHYHATFYQNVEALSVTPFAPGALDRGLSALLVALVRLSGTEFNGNHEAGKITRSHPYVQTAINTIVQRAAKIGDALTRNRLRDELQATLDIWLDQAQNRPGGGTLVYKARKRSGTEVDLLQAPENRGQWQKFTCLNSLRNVEPTIGLILQDSPPDEDNDRLPEPMPLKIDPSDS